jgi:hypothetical protein
MTTAPAKIVRCETSDLPVPANAEIVIEGRVLTSEGLRPRLGRIADERPTYPYTFSDSDFVYRHQAGTGSSARAG